MTPFRSQITVCSNVRLDNRYLHTLFFPTVADQTSYFNVLSGKTTYTDYSYLRKNNSIQLKADIATAENWSYLYVKNPGEITHYYFINEVKYINDEVVELVLELDVMQTYMLYCTLLPSFVEREHSADDVVGKYTLDEGMETGTLVSYYERDLEVPLDMCLLVQSTIDIDLSASRNVAVSFIKGQTFNNVYSGLRLSAVLPEDFSAFGLLLEKLETIGAIDGVLNMWMYPRQCVGISTSASSDVCRGVTNITPVTVELPGVSTRLNNSYEGKYTPRNNKLYCYPYNMLYVTNNSGGCATYHWERFHDALPTAKLYGGSTPDASLIFAPEYYEGSEGANFDEALTLGNFPSCAWNADPYLVWLAQNQHTNANTMNQAIYTAGMGAVQAVAGAGSLNVQGAVSGLNTSMSGYFQQQALIAQARDMDIQPPQAKGNQSVSTNVLHNKQTFTMICKSITAEYAKIIDDFLSMYGYKVNRVKVPNRCVREHWTHVKTVGCNITGNIPKDHLLKIATIFDHGVTFWNDVDRIGDYGNMVNQPL